MDFKVNDHVYASDWCEGIITHIENDVAYVMYTTERGGGCMAFGLDELEHVPERKATMNTCHMVLTLGHKSFTTGKIVVVELPDEYILLATYKQKAKEKACEKLGLNEKEVSVLDFNFLGEDVLFV